MARPRSSAIDRAIIGACLELLEEVGRAGLSRDQIARRAGVSLPAVNRRYADVDAILTAVVSTPIYVDPSPPPADDLRSYLTGLLTRAVETFAQVPIRRPTAEVLAAAAGNTEIAAALVASLEQVQSETIRRFELARERGELRADADAQLLVDMMNGSLYYRLLWRGEAMTRSDVAPVVEHLLRSASKAGPL